MTEIRDQTSPIADYPYHLPDKPFPQGKVSYQEFLDWADEDTLAEWVNGEIVMASPASSKHQRITDFLNRVVGIFVEVRELGVTYSGPFQMKLPDASPENEYKGSGREPDLTFIAKNREDRVGEIYLNGPADLVIEVVSKESRTRDRITKFDEYQAARIPEYWLIDPSVKVPRVTFYQLDANGQYQAMPLDSEGKYYSQTLPGFWLKVDWLWQKNPPDVSRVLQEILGKTYIQHQLKMGGTAYTQMFIEELREQGFLPPLQ